MSSSDFLIFTDGACSGNPGPGGWGAIIHDPGGETIELGGHAEHTTNNRMEMLAASEALKKLAKMNRPEIRVHLCTDSRYLIDGITKWIHGWKKRGWVSVENGSPIKNQDIWMELSEVLEKHPNKTKVYWVHIAGHSMFAGNERCDEIAVAFSKGESCELYQGPSARYSIKLELPKPDTDSGPKKTYYLSLIRGEIHRDDTWEKCQRRVQGVPGVRFKKVKSLREEEEVLKLWGYLKSPPAR